MREMTIIATQIPARIRKARERIGLTQGQLAEKCGMARARICEVENGKGSLLVVTLKRIAAGLDVQMNYFFRVDNRRGRA